jgi:hypothetical protein
MMQRRQQTQNTKDRITIVFCGNALGHIRKKKTDIGFSTIWFLGVHSGGSWAISPANKWGLLYFIY